MPDSPEGDSLNCSLHIKDYIDAAYDAARGTRVVTIVLAVACVLIFIGFWNSHHASWSHKRLRSAYDPADTTIYKTLDVDKHPKILSLSLFRVNYSEDNDPLDLLQEFKDPLSLIKKLSESSDHLSVYIYTQLSPETRVVLMEAVQSGKVGAELKNALAADFNNKILLANKPLDKGLFENLSIGEETKKLWESRPDGTELIRLNRLLLEAAYPDEIAKCYDIPKDTTGREMLTTPAELFRKEIQQESVRAHVENVRLVRAPFFGIAFDVNDLGVIGGIGFIIILLLLRHSLSREIKSLNRSFRVAYDTNQLRHFYHVLAIRQVFTVPEMEGEKQNRLLALSQKAVSILPVIVFSVVVYYDFSSVSYYDLFSWREVGSQLKGELFLLWPLILYLSLKCLERLRTIDSIWDDYWSKLPPKKSPIILLDK